MECNQDSNTGSENKTSFRTHTNVTTPDKKDHLEGKADKEAPSYAGTEEFRKKARGEQRRMEQPLVACENNIPSERNIYK